MHKKIIMACMAIAAFAAFVVAPAASASPVLTSGGVSVPAGTSVTGKNTGNTLFEGGFAVTCSTADLKGTVTANTGTTIAGEVPVGNAEFTGTGAGGDCTSALGDVKPTVNSRLCFDTGSVTTPGGTVDPDAVTITGCGNPVTFTLNVTNIVTCKYEVASVTGTYVTNASATVNLNKQPANRELNQSGLCPATGALTMDFDLYTTGGTLLTVS